MNDMDNQNIQWLNTITTESHTRVAAKLDLSQSTISRMVMSPTPNPTTVRDIARTYGADTITALHAAGFLTTEEIAGHRNITPLHTTPSAELLQELLRRERATNQ